MRSFKTIILFFILINSSSISYAFISDYQLNIKIQEGFVAGQVWSYETRADELKSTITVLKVDYFESAIVVHIRVDNISLNDPEAPQGIRMSVSHMAFLETALQKSVINLMANNSSLPEFSKQYETWRKGDGIGTAWAWHFSIIEALNGLEKIYEMKQQSSALEK